MRILDGRVFLKGNLDPVHEILRCTPEDTRRAARQRLAIASAVLADPRILILDEATSNLDSESERLIQQSLAELMRGRTSFVIAHRLSTIAKADRIVVLQEGRIVESGTHDQLLARRGRYRQMVELQMDVPQQA